MKLLKYIINILKGGVHANDTGGSSSRRDEYHGRIFHTFTTARERALSDLGGIRMLEKALANERSRDIGGEPSDPVLRESGCLIAAARSPARELIDNLIGNFNRQQHKHEEVCQA